jgi:hypothetical protein
MTRYTIRQTLNLVLGDQARPDHFLVRRRRFVGHVEHFRARANVALGMAMAVDAPAHIESVDFKSQRHLIDAAVTGRASDAFIHVNAVIEIDEIGEIVDSRPRNRLAGAITGADRFQNLGVGPDLRVTSHARFCGRQTRERGGFDGRVTVAAVDAIVTDVMFMTERDGLVLGDSHIGGEGARVEFVRRPDERTEGQHQTSDADFRKAIRTRSENLRHRSRPVASRSESGQPVIRMTAGFLLLREIFFSP